MLSVIGTDLQGIILKVGKREALKTRGAPALLLVNAGTFHGGRSITSTHFPSPATQQCLQVWVLLPSCTDNYRYGSC